MDAPRLPLSRFRVIDLTHHRAGPTCVRHLADWGAQVVRIDRPAAGEEVAGSRHSSDFQNLHRNKRSLSLNLKSESGKQVFMDLARDSDVIVENMRVDVKHRLGVDYESVRKVNPRIVYGSISGFGQEGPYSKLGGVDQIAQGMGGLMSITGLPGQGPVRVGIPIADLTAGGFLAQAILIALLDREATGQGAWVHTSLLEAQIAMLDFQATRWLMKGEVPRQAGNDHPTSIPTGVFPTKDGHVNIAATAQNLWTALCETLGADDLLADPEIQNGPGRSKDRERINARISEITRTDTSAAWVAKLNEAGVPCGPINTIDQTFADPQVQYLGMAQPVNHPALGEIRLVAQPNNISGFTKKLRTATPEAGEHTDAVLKELGYDAKKIAALREEGAV
ncbi:MAG: CaiB/BaiF CoA-transferase family protein [Acetobacterales bacterium]